MMISFKIMLTICPLLVDSLKCYVGEHGEPLDEVEVDPKKKMCRFAPRNFCVSNREQTKYTIEDYDKSLVNTCRTYGKMENYCYCAKELCNGHYAMLKQMFIKTTNASGDTRECILKYMSQFLNYEDERERRRKEEEGEETTDEAPPEEFVSTDELNSLTTPVSTGAETIKCYEGVFGGELKIVEVNSKKHMCRYEPRNICEPYKDSKYGTAPYDPAYENKCREVEKWPYCYCTTDLCNGNYNFMKDLWSKSEIEDERVHECVNTYFINMIKSFQNASHYQEEVAKMTTIEYEPDEENFNGASKDNSESEAESTEPGPGQSEAGAVPQEPEPGSESKSEEGQTTSTTSSGELVVIRDDKADKNLDVQGKEFDASKKGPKKRKYNWSWFIILAVIAGILVFIVIPVLLVLIALKYRRVNRAAHRGKKAPRMKY
ncbi:unnamed protein product [Cylicocyclus nassatus]|uniref:Uncharacterized protein n=1 Tax=Cylicocyclus nassatus TaxID=53992 RepID=A0AA36DNJ9_CYLNA|nr:unnamed protein product [Cylicocyclus nassatus]